MRGFTYGITTLCLCHERKGRQNLLTTEKKFTGQTLPKRFNFITRVVGWYYRVTSSSPITVTEMPTLHTVAVHMGPVLLIQIIVVCDH